MKINLIVRKRWASQGVKFKPKSFTWIKTLRTATCAMCGKLDKETYLDQGFSGWSILIHVSNVEGKAPEVCPKCLPCVSNQLTVKPPRMIKCAGCGEIQREKIYGIGFPGWSPLPSLGIIGQRREQPCLCPNCSLKLAMRLGQGFIRETWTDLTYPAQSLLTSTKMTQNQDNFAALGAGDSGAPDVYNLKSGLDANKSGSPSEGDVYIATDTEKTYACYSAGTWTEVGGAPVGLVHKNVDFAHIDQFYKEGSGSLSIGEGSFKVTNAAGDDTHGGLMQVHFGGKGLSFDIKHQFLCRVYFEALTTAQYMWGMGGILLETTRQSFGFYYDNLTRVVGYNNNGVNYVYTDLWTPEGAGWRREILKAILYPGEKIEFYRSGTLMGTSTTYLPSGDYPYTGLKAYLMTAGVWSSGQARTNYVESWVVSQAEYTEEAP